MGVLYGRPAARYALPGDNVFPEGITEGGGTVFYVGSMGDGTIYRGDTATSDVQAFVPANGDGRVTVTGMDLDGYGRLIACDYDGGHARSACRSRRRRAHSAPMVRLDQ